MTIRMIKNGIAVIGSTTIDKIVTGNLSRLKIGGVPAYSGITYARHGINTFAVTNIAKQDSDINERLRRENIALCTGRTDVTTHFINFIKDTNRRQKLPQRAAPISRGQVIGHVKGINFAHLGPLFPSDIDSRALTILNNLDLCIISDIQGLVRSVKNNRVYPAVSKYLDDMLEISRIVKANELEYQLITDFYQMNLFEIMSRFKIDEFIITGGEKGGFVKDKTGEEIHYETAKVKSIEDPTGAGDIFLAAYVIGRFLNRQPIKVACKYAAKMASRQIEGKYITQADLRIARITGN